MISVIVPVYKVEKYLHRCVDSILAQSYSDFELLLIDDGSPDNSGTICDEYAAKDSRVRVFHKENGGVSSARNLGLDNARGEWITFCDADDYVSPDWLSFYEVAITKNVDVAVQGMFHIDENGKICPKALYGQIAYTKEDKQKIIVELINQCVFGYVGVKLFRKDIIIENKIFFDEESAVWEDGQFIAKYLEFAKSYLCVDGIGYYYYLPPANKTYNGTSIYAVYNMLKSFDIIFEKNIPQEIVFPWFHILKNYMVTCIINGKALEADSLDLYGRILEIKGENKNSIIHFLILHSKFSFFAPLALKGIHMLMKVKEKLLAK